MFTQFDIIVSFIILIFSTFGLFKGAIRSILGLAKWYGAGILTILFYPQVRDIVSGVIQPGMIVNGIAVFITYVVILIVLSILIGIFVAALGGTVGGVGDKLMGAVVGATIGIIIASTAHYFVRSFGGGKDPAWLQNGKTYSLTSQGADKLQNYFKDIVQKMGSDMGISADLDPSGSLQEKIRKFQDETGSQVDFERLKDAIRMMKEDGMNPDQIKDLINIQDYMVMPQQGGSNVMNGATNEASGAVNGIVKKIQDFQKNNIPVPAPATDDGQE